MGAEIGKDDGQWREQLTEEQYEVARCGGTERAFTGKYWDHKAKGIYRCVCCASDLFRSESKYDSGSGWPSFWQPAEPRNIETRSDHSHGMVRVEVLCAQCEAHLGHVFPDGPEPTGMRYCINSVSLALRERGD